MNFKEVILEKGKTKHLKLIRPEGYNSLATWRIISGTISILPDADNNGATISDDFEGENVISVSIGIYGIVIVVTTIDPNVDGFNITE